jgi:hypothetical protein
MLPQRPQLSLTRALRLGANGDIMAVMHLDYGFVIRSSHIAKFTDRRQRAKHDHHVDNRDSLTRLSALVFMYDGAELVRVPPGKGL